MRRATPSPTVAPARRAPAPLVALLGAALLVAAGPAPLAAQARPTGATYTLAGAVVDTAGAPVMGAEVRLVPRGTAAEVVPPRLPTTRGAEAGAFSDATGAFVLLDVPADTVQLVVRRIGYRPATVEVAPAPAGGRAEIEVSLVPNAVQLRTVIVEGRAFDGQLWDAGFYHRERVGSGRFYGPELLERFGGATIGTLLRETPRLTIDRRNNQEFAYGPVAGSRCQLNVFVDGRFAREAMGRGGMGLEEIVPRPDVYAIEVYPTSNAVPSEFARIGPAVSSALSEPARRIPLPPNRGQVRGSATGTAARLLNEDAQGEEQNSDAACGALVIWTRPFALRKAGSTPPPQ